MKKIILSCVALMIAAVSYAQQPQIDKTLAAKEQLVELIEEYDLSTEQITALKKYYELDMNAANEKVSAADLQQKKAAVMNSLKSVLPQAVLTELEGMKKSTLSPSPAPSKF